METEKHRGGAVVADASSDTNETRRRAWMGVLARAPRVDLERAWDGIGDKPSYDWLRRPEIGLIMVKARAGGSGDAFHFTEMTMTRCALQLADGTTGHAFVKGRDRRHAELAAVFDALMQRADQRVCGLIERLAAERDERRRLKSQKSASTKVDFFTMVSNRTSK